MVLFNCLTLRILTLRIVAIAALIALSGCANKFATDDYLTLGDKYQVVIERDHLGVPHVIGERDVDAAFGFAYAQAEDNWQIIHDTIPFYRGTNAAINGKDAATVDFLVQWLGIWETIDRDYETQLKPETRAWIGAFVDGINYYAALHPEQTNPSIFPITEKDVVAGYMLRHLLFYGFDASITELFEPQRQRPVSRGPADADIQARPMAEGVTIGNLPVGSNAIAVSAPFTIDGATRLAINSHQPTTGPVAWYEAHIQSKEGLNVMGGLFPSSATIGVGFTENLAWGATVNKPDLVDIYVLDMDPNDPMRYKLDGEWKTLEAKDIEIEVKLFGFLPWTVTEVGLKSEHGPVIQNDHGTYAVRYAGMSEVRQLEQWLAMSKAQNFEQWRDAMRLQAFASFNFVYADREGNTMFVHNSLTPKRLPSYDWAQYLPGDDSRLIWQDYMAFDDLPQVINPASGYIHSANQTPFRVSAETDNPNKDDYAIEDGFPTRMTNRADRGLELLAELESISEQQFFDIKHDKKYSVNSRAYAYLQQAASADLGAIQGDNLQNYQDAQTLITNWDLSTDIENRGAALSACVLGGEWLSEQRGSDAPKALDELVRCTDLLMSTSGRIDPLWGDVNRHVRGDLNIPVAGGPDTLRAIYGMGMEKDGYLTNVAGDGLYYQVSWDAQGDLKVRGVHQYGAATIDENSPHYADQAEDYANEILHDPLFDDARRQSKIERRYRPGE
ncbi:acylase [Porticoccaceae bacterium]|nr:acylase [Porticoccaceae bacterium]